MRKYLLFADTDNEVMGVVERFEAWEPEKEFVAAVMSMGYNLLTANLNTETLPKELFTEGNRIFTEALERAEDIGRQLQYDNDDNGG